MRPATLLELADKYGVHLPEALTGGEPPQTAGHGRARLVPLPAALRHRALLPARARGHPAAGARGRRGGRRGRLAAGWRSRSTRPRTRPRLGGLIPALEIILDAVDTASRDTGLGMRGAGRREPDEAPAGRAHAGPARGAVRGPRRRRLRALQRRAARAWPGTSTGPSPSPGRAGCWRRRTAASWPGPSSVRDCLDDLRRGPDRARRAGRRGPAAAARLAERGR